MTPITRMTGITKMTRMTGIYMYTKMTGTTGMTGMSLDDWYEFDDQDVQDDWDGCDDSRMQQMEWGTLFTQMWGTFVGLKQLVKQDTVPLKSKLTLEAQNNLKTCPSRLEA